MHDVLAFTHNEQPGRSLLRRALLVVPVACDNALIRRPVS